jgi:Dyp-type peroxidase family
MGPKAPSRSRTRNAPVARRRAPGGVVGGPQRRRPRPAKVGPRIVRQPVREAPFPRLDRAGVAAAQLEALDEDVIDIRNIQGNILAGFNKDFQTLLFLRIVDATEFREWLKELVPFVASTAEVLAFNRLFKQIRARRRSDSRAVQATWMNLAFTASGLQKLAPRTLGKFKDTAFRRGLHPRSAALGDPTSGEGSPEHWVVGGPKNEADVMLIFAADDRDDLFAEVARIEDGIFAARAADGRPLRCGVEIVFKQHGAVLPQPLTGHEHFGFLDGISQPGLRGRISDDPRDVLTLRQNPDEPDQGKPGQSLIWPGEFVFGYHGQDPTANTLRARGPDSRAPEGKPVVPEWARDGSYLVFRRLRQDVPAFRSFIRDQAARLGLSAELLSAKIVGRFRSGAPLMRTIDHDDAAVAADDCVNNDFLFGAAVARRVATPIARKLDDSLCRPALPAEPDETGAVCPFAAHIRKTNPRNDTGTRAGQIGAVTTATHLLLRRGIPFGTPYPENPSEGVQDSGDRGLLFLAYQTSIEEQFEFVQRAWANDPQFKDRSERGSARSGHDLIIGQNGGPGDERRRHFVLPLTTADGTLRHEIIETTEEWVIPTGGGYFFAPSIAALTQLANDELR